MSLRRRPNLEFEGKLGGGEMISAERCKPHVEGSISLAVRNSSVSWSMGIGHESRSDATGVWNESLVEPVARALRLLGARNTRVVHGADGLAEISLAVKTLIAESRQAETPSAAIQPELARDSVTGGYAAAKRDALARETNLSR